MWDDLHIIHELFANVNLIKHWDNITQHKANIEAQNNVVHHLYAFNNLCNQPWLHWCLGVKAEGKQG